MITGTNNLTLRTQLLSELTNRKSRNASYSLRAFARDLGVGSTTLSDFLSQKRKLSKSNVQKIIENLGFSPIMKEQFFLENKTRKDKKTHEQIEKKIILEEDAFRLISDWYYLAILNIAQLKNNRAEPSWLALRLGLDVQTIEAALDRLFRLNLLKVDGKKLARTSEPLTTTNDIPSAAIRKHHGQNLILAEKSLYNEPVERRDFSSVTMTVNKEKLAKAKEILRKTRDKIADLLSDDNATEVYTLSFQLFPLLKEEPQGDRK